MANPQFIPLTLAEFERLVARYDFSARRIDSVHMHHTWRPRKRDFRGLASIIGMWKFHTQNNGWSDIAQHVTIDPDGIIWTGRSWRQAPASSSNFNGSSRLGPFMFEMIGDFDVGKETLEGAQLRSVVGVIAAIQDANGLPPETLRFHRDLGSPKSCPGSGVDYATILTLVRNAHVVSTTRAISIEPTLRARKRGAPATGDDAARSAFGGDETRIEDALSLLSATGRALETNDGGMDDLEDEAGPQATALDRDLLVERAPVSRDASRELDAGTTARLRRHVINLVQGAFVPTGIFQTSKEDVDAIFSEHLPQALSNATNEKPLRIVLWAHGGLVSERSALAKAAELSGWWRANEVYPIHFVWETGLLETVNQLVSNAASRAPSIASRDLWDYTTDPLIERLASPLGRTLWSGMKRSAERASAPGGGARYVADKLATLIEDAGGRVEIHAVGHSAGSIFHSQLLPVLAERKVKLKTLTFLAPAVRIDTFWEQTRGIVDNDAHVETFTMFTMARDWEKRDSCAGVYKKSLLYLVSLAFEPEGKTPLLGLEEFVRKDKATSDFLGLGGAVGKGEVIWSKSVAASGRNATQSIVHGDFDDDPSTMNSVMRRILGKDDVAHIVEYQRSNRQRESEVDDMPADLALFLRKDDDRTEDDRRDGTATPGAQPTTPAKRPSSPSGGKRRALCIGIDAYAEAPLYGCVADAKKWATLFRSLEFSSVKSLTNEQATQQAIVSAVTELLESSDPGDVLALQYAGHGTNLPDVDGDEVDDGRDEALVPYDYLDGNFIIDDDLRALFASMKTGLNLTCFFDCCHSGTITRLTLPRPEGAMPARGRVKSRYLTISDDVTKRHVERRKRARSRATGPSLSPAQLSGPMREVVFCACRSDQRAFESDGQGDFTRIATQIIEETATKGLSHAEFRDKITRAFGSTARQEPQLNCDESVMSSLLLSPFARKD